MQKITPYLWVEKDAKAVADYYLSIFKGGKLKDFRRFGSEESGNEAGIETAVIEIAGMEFSILAAGPLFKFNEAVSFVINTNDQAETDYYWEALTRDGGEEGSCGWCKDKYGLSWQVVPTEYFELIHSSDPVVREKSHEEYANTEEINPGRVKISLEFPDHNMKFLSCFVLSVFGVVLHATAQRHSDLYLHVDSLIRYQIGYKFDETTDALPKMLWDSTRHSNGPHLATVSQKNPSPLIMLNGELVKRSELDRHRKDEVLVIMVYTKNDSVIMALYGAQSRNGMLIIQTSKHGKR